MADKCRCRPTKSGYQEVAISLESLSNRRSRHRGTAIAVDGPLDKHIAEREHHALQACGDADAQNGTALAPIEPQLPDTQSQGSGFVAEYTDHTGCTVDIADGCGYGHTGHTQMADDDKEEIEHRIDQPGHKENIEWPTGVALTAKDRGSKIVDKEKRSPKKIDAQIKNGIIDDVGRGLHEGQHRPGDHHADNKQNQSADNRQHYGGAHGTANALNVALPNPISHDGIGTNRYADKEVDHQIDEKRVGTHCRQSLTAGKPTDYSHVYRVEQLLQYATGRKGQCKFQQLARERPMEHIHLIRHSPSL